MRESGGGGGLSPETGERRDHRDLVDYQIGKDGSLTQRV